MRRKYGGNHQVHTLPTHVHTLAHIIVAAMCIKFRFHADLFTLRFILFVCLERGHKKIIGKVLKSVTTLREMFEIPRIERKNKKP